MTNQSQSLSLTIAGAVADLIVSWILANLPKKRRSSNELQGQHQIE
jgi:hypothetical protein